MGTPESKQSRPRQDEAVAAPQQLQRSQLVERQQPVNNQPGRARTGPAASSTQLPTLPTQTDAPAVALHSTNASYNLQVVLPPNFDRQSPLVGANALRLIIGEATRVRIVTMAATDVNGARAALRTEIEALYNQVNQSGDAVALQCLRAVAAAPADAYRNYFSAGRRLQQLAMAEITQSASSQRGTSSAASVGLLHPIVQGTNVAAMQLAVRALRQAEARRTTSGEERILCVGEGLHLDLMLNAADAATCLRELDLRITQLRSASSQIQSSDNFSATFNNRFSAILPSLRSAGATPTNSESTSSSGAFTATELQQLFTPAQRSALASFFADRRIPDRLFNGDQHGGWTPAQRTLIAAEILARGEYRPGSFNETQRLHARMCGHWVRLVQAYAGVAVDSGIGMDQQFDHEGHLVLTGGTQPTNNLDTRQNRNPTQQLGRNGRMQGVIPVEQYDQFRPGDWLYIFTNTATVDGNHSVIFGGWEGPTRHVTTPQPVAYRLARLFSQTSEARGGAADVVAVGSAYVMAAGHLVHPVTHRFEVRGEMRQPETLDDISQHVLNNSGSAAAVNRALIISEENRRRGGLNMRALVERLQQTNDAMLGQLATTMAHGDHIIAPGQLTLLRETNRFTDIETLVRLNERLQTFTYNASNLARIDGIVTARTDAQRSREAPALNREIAIRNELLAPIDAELQHVDATVGALRHLRDTLAAELAHERRGHHNSALATYTNQVRLMLRGQGTTLSAPPTEATPAIAQAYAAYQAAAAANHAVTPPRNIVVQARHLTARQNALRGEIAQFQARQRYQIAHPAALGAFHGVQHRPELLTHGNQRDSVVPQLTGSLANVQPALDWSELIEAGRQPIGNSLAPRRSTPRH